MRCNDLMFVYHITLRCKNSRENGLVKPAQHRFKFNDSTVKGDAAMLTKDAMAHGLKIWVFNGQRCVLLWYTNGVLHPKQRSTQNEGQRLTAFGNHG